MTKYKTIETGIEIGDVIQINDSMVAVKILPFTFLLIWCDYSYKIGRLNVHDPISQSWFSYFDKLLKYE